MPSFMNGTLMQLHLHRFLFKAAFYWLFDLVMKSWHKTVWKTEDMPCDGSNVIEGVKHTKDHANPAITIKYLRYEPSSQNKWPDVELVISSTYNLQILL